MNKEKVLELLENERERAGEEKLEEHNVVVEFKKIEGGYGVIKGFVYRREKILGSLCSEEHYCYL